MLERGGRRRRNERQSNGNDLVGENDFDGIEKKRASTHGSVLPHQHHQRDAQRQGDEDPVPDVAVQDEVLHYRGFVERTKKELNRGLDTSNKHDRQEWSFFLLPFFQFVFFP